MAAQTAQKAVPQYKFATGLRPVPPPPAIHGGAGAAATIAIMMIITTAITSTNTSAAVTAVTTVTTDITAIMMIIITSAATGAAANPCDYRGHVNHHGHDNQRAIVAQANAGNRPRGSIVAVRSRDEWGELIQDIGGIGAGAAAELLWWYTFDPRVSAASVPIQPFLEILPGHLIVPMNLITDSNVERNLQKLLSRHPNLRSFYQTVKNAKESIALAHLSSLFPAMDFAVKPTAIIKGVTDADLLIYNRVSGFVLVIQHKWLIAPETVSESSSNDEQLSEGVRQALEARDIFRKDRTLLRRVLELKDDQPIDRVEAVVICRGAEQTGFLGKPAVPVVLERAYEELWGQSSFSLAKLWEKLSSRPNHARAAGRYGDTQYR